MKSLSPVDRYLNELLDFGGEPCTRAEIIADMQCQDNLRAYPQASRQIQWQGDLNQSRPGRTRG